MTLKELKNKVTVTRWHGYGQYKVRIIYRGKEYFCHSNNSMAFDRAIDPEKSDGYYTTKQAWQAFYDECKQKNHLGEFSY